MGGQGASPYLYDHPKLRYASAGINVLQSGGMKPYVHSTIFEPHAHILGRRTAICRGAVFKGFLDGVRSGDIAADLGMIGTPITITSTISRASFGTGINVPWDASKYLEQDKFWDTDEHVWKAANQMFWFLKRVCLQPLSHFTSLTNESPGRKRRKERTFPPGRLPHLPKGS